jgi:peptide/nickel transport system substrate-binding protein
VAGAASAALLTGCGGSSANNAARNVATKAAGTAVTTPGAAPSSAGTLAPRPSTSGTPFAINGFPASWQVTDETAAAVPGGIYPGVSTAEYTGGFDAIASTNFTTQAVANAVYELLLRRKTGPGIDSSLDLDVEGNLAQSFELAPDGMSIALKLRQGIRFHNLAPVNGRTMDIDDWHTSMDRYLALNSYRSVLQGVLDSVQYPDATTMVVKTKFPYAPLSRLFSSTTASPFIMPKESAGGAMDPAKTAIGTGAQMFDKYTPSSTLEYVKHAQYWRQGMPFMDRFQYPIVVDYAQRYAQFVAGNIAVFTPTQDAVVQAKKDLPTAVAYRAAIPKANWIGWYGLKDFDSQPYRDPRVRQALSMMFDRAGFAAQFNNDDTLKKAGLPTHAVRWQTAVSGGQTTYWLDPQKNQLGDASKYWQLDLTAANQLLDAAGYRNGFTLDVWNNGGGNYGSTYEPKVQVTIDMFQASGRIKVVRHTPPYMPDWYNNIYNSATRDFVGIGFWTNNLVDPDIDQELFATWHSSAGNTFKGIKDPMVDDMIQQQRVELDQQKRIGIIQNLQKYMATQMYALPWDPLTDSFYFQWSWLHNTGWPIWSQWLASDKPHRNG